MDLSLDLFTLWHGLGWPLCRLIFFVSLGLLTANLIEALNWTGKVARLTAPLIRRAHLPDLCGASFAMAFFSGVAANTMLAEGFDQGTIDRRQLVLANLFNSLPTYLLHLPTLFFIAVPLIKQAALLYVGLTLAAALLRTATILLVGRLLLPVPGGDYCVDCQLEEAPHGLQKILTTAWQRFRKRIRRILLFTVPIYIAIFLLHRGGGFARLERAMAGFLQLLPWLHPQSLGIIILHIMAEFTAGLAAAGALLEAGTIPVPDLIIALLVGNILSSPVRAIRHQFPFYAGIFPTGLAGRLIVYNQLFRMVSLIVVSLFFFAVWPI